MTIRFKKAVRRDLKLKMLIAGIEKTGKTYTALQFATELNNGGGIAFVDTEHESALRYADDFEFDHVAMTNFNPANYARAIKSAAEQGYDVIVLDSITHGWNGQGGMLDMVGGNFNKWKDVRPIEKDFIDTLLGTDIHVIATARQEKKTQVDTDDRGKKVIRDVGLAIVQSKGIEYEFDVVVVMDKAHNLTVDSSRLTPLPNGTRIHAPTGEAIIPLVRWLAGAPAEAVNPPAEEGAKGGKKEAFRALFEKSVADIVTDPEVIKSKRVSLATLADNASTFSGGMFGPIDEAYVAQWVVDSWSNFGDGEAPSATKISDVGSVSIEIAKTFMSEHFVDQEAS